MSQLQNGTLFLESWEPRDSPTLVTLGHLQRVRNLFSTETVTGYMSNEDVRLRSSGPLLDVETRLDNN